MRRKKFILLGCTVAMSAMLLTGCGGSSVESTESTYEETTGENMESEAAGGEAAADKDGANKAPGMEISEDAVTVKVTAVDGSTITAEVGEMGGRDRMNGEKPEGAGEKPEGEAPENAGERPENADREKPQGGRGGGMFTSTGESITFTITDSTSITVGGGQNTEKGTVEDITTDSILIITLDENNQALTIMVKNFNMGGGAPENAAPEGEIIE